MLTVIAECYNRVGTRVLWGHREEAFTNWGQRRSQKGGGI